MKELPPPGTRISEASVYCGSETDSFNNCTCFAPLDCTGGSCATLDESLKQIRELAAGKVKGQSLGCTYVETGACGDMTYMLCDSGLSYNVRYFDAKKGLVGTKNRSDIMEYCELRSPVKYSGIFHECTMKKTKVLFGKRSS